MRRDPFSKTNYAATAELFGDTFARKHKRAAKRINKLNRGK